MSDFERTYATVADFAAAELKSRSGEELLLKWTESDAGRSLPTEFRTEHGMAELLEELTCEFTECWRSDEFREVVEQHGDGLLINIETGDFPELINAGYPWSDQEEFDYGGITDLATQPFCRLDELLTAIAGKPFNEMAYFEFADLTSHHIGPEYDDWYEVDETMEAKRVLLAAVGLVTAVRSLQAMVADGTITSPIWLSVSEGCQVIGAFTRAT
ncbi:MAG: hypothetical protein ABJZ55_01190 [Fuerstiella sp.]